MKHILFISDNSVTHPILQSQGIPHMVRNSEKYRFSLITFETVKDYNKREFKKINSYLVSQNINLIPCRLPKSLFPNGRFWVWLLGILNAFNLCIKDKPSVIHTRSFPPTFIGILCKYVFGVKILFDMRGIYVDEIVEAGIIQRNTVIYRIERFLEKIYLKYSDAFVSVSENHRKFVNAQYPALEDIPRKNFLIRNCVDVDKFTLSVQSLKKFDELKLVYAGNFTTKYDIEGIYNFFRELLNVAADPELLIMTYIDEKPFYELLYNYSERMQKKVKVKKCESSEIPEIINKCDVGMLLLHTFPSNFVSAPIKFIEYLAAGIPVVLNENIGDCNEIVEKYNVGITIKSNDFKSAVTNLKNLLCQSSLKERCRSVAMIEFNINDACRKYDDLYSKLIYSRNL